MTKFELIVELKTALDRAKQDYIKNYSFEDQLLSAIAEVLLANFEQKVKEDG